MDLFLWWYQCTIYVLKESSIQKTRKVMLKITMKFSLQHLSIDAFSQRSNLSSVSSGAASQAAMVNAFVAADTKKSWKGMAMAAGGSGGGVFQQSFGGRDKRLPPPDIHYSNRLSIGHHTPLQQPRKKGVTYLIMTAK